MAAVGRERGRLADAGAALVRPLHAALATGVADPPPPRAAWRTPDTVQHLARYLRVRAIDAVVVAEVFLALAIVAGTNTALVDAYQRGRAAAVDGELFVLAALAAAVPLVLRDRWPLAAWRVSIPSMVLVVALMRQVYGQGVFDNPFPAGAPYPVGAILTYLLVLYSVGVRCERRISIGVWLVSLLGMWVLHLGSSVLLGAIMTAVALVFGYNVRVRRAAQHRVAEEEQRTEDMRAARAVLEERARIARELHDVVAHHMSVIAIQAEAAPIKSPDDPATLRAELAGIRTTALTALAELRRVLGVLRNGDRAPETTPQPDLSRVDDLVDRARAAGLAVTVTTSGQPVDNPPGVGLAAYRVLQESLSNALRHAPGAPVRVGIDHRSGSLTVRVENDPPPAPAPLDRSPRGGQGLAGMRERVSAHGGTISAGSTPSGGFVVAATFPLQPTPAPAEAP
jgi:signal transduction histidine kinase